MKTLLERLTESKGKDFEITLYFDDFDNDFYNVMSEVFFRYSDNKEEPSEEDFDKAVKNFKEKFFTEN